MKPDFCTTLDFDNAKSKAEFYSRLKRCTGKALVTVESIGPKRTMAQNAFYWACVVKMLADCFMDSGQCDSDAEAKESAHEHLKEKFLLRAKLNPTTGEVLRIAGSTRRLSVGAFVEYIEKCLSYLQTEWGCVIPADQSFRTEEK